MDLENQQSQELATEEVASTPHETEGGEIKKSLESQHNHLPNDLEGQQAVVTEEAKPDFVPNFEYKVLGEVKQFDEKIRGLIKDKDTEELLRKLHCKADGIESIQADRETARGQYKALQAEVNQVLTMAEQGNLRGVLDSVGVKTNDISAVLNGLGFSKRDIIEHAYQLANLTPEQEQYQTQLRQAEVERQSLARQSQMMQSQLEQVQVHTRTTELQTALSRPEVAPIVQAFDQAHGNGSFFQEVANRGALYWHTRQVDVPVDQLVKEVLALARPYQPQQTTPATQVRKEDLPVIPVMGSGGGKAPVSKRVRSLDEMRSFAQTLSD